MPAPLTQPNRRTTAEPGAMTLVDIARCPVCGGVERVESDGMSVRKLQGLHYLKHAAAGLGLSVEDFADRVKTFRCASCGSYFCDPWLSPELASSIFNAGAPDHIAGWAEFEHWLYPPSANLVQLRNRRLSAAVTRRIGAVSAYAEFGCPFQGLLLEFRGQETAPRERVSLFARMLQRPPDVRWTKIPRLHHAMQRWAGRLAVFALRLRAFKQGLVAAGKGRRAEPRNGAVLPSLPARRYLLTEDTTRGWGSNCVRYGASCQYFAHTVLGADVIPLEEAHRTGAPKCNLIGLFNVLDHTAVPLDVLRRCLGLTDHILIASH